jgi:hypothetical protein
LVISLLLAGCATTSTDGTGTATPPVDELAKVGEQIDKADARISAGVQVARNANALGKPAVVEKELAVVASYLPAPDPHNLAYISNRVTRNDPEEYKRAMEAGAKMLTTINAGWAKAEVDAEKNKQALDSANKVIAQLKADNAKLKDDLNKSEQNVVVVGFVAVGSVCFIAALVLAVMSQYIRALGAFAVGSAIGSLPYLFASPYFMPSVGGVFLLGLLLGGWHLYSGHLNKSHGPQEKNADHRDAP